ncbi:hypothetical protein [Streptomyces luteireticuli]|uniref:hypothetical protein n=1 Tax=Streptomyces luteireticuli TaxID=173858 RepID=UPI0035585422
MTGSGWSVYLEFDARDVPDEVHDRLLEDLAGLHVAPTTAPNGNFAVLLTLDAANCDEAFAAARSAAQASLTEAFGPCGLVGFEVLTEAEFIERESVPELVGRQEIAEMLGVSPQRVTQIMETPLFQKYAKPVAALRTGAVFRAKDIRAFLRNWDRRPGKRAKS